MFGHCWRTQAPNNEIKRLFIDQAIQSDNRPNHICSTNKTYRETIAAAHWKSASQICQKGLNVCP